MAVYLYSDTRLVPRADTEHIVLTCHMLSAGLKNNGALSYCTFGAACTEVELDMLTGEQRVLRSDILFDCGRSINPALDMGQVCALSTALDTSAQRSCRHLHVSAHGSAHPCNQPPEGVSLGLYQAVKLKVS